MFATSLACGAHSEKKGTPSHLREVQSVLGFSGLAAKVFGAAGALPNITGSRDPASEPRDIQVLETLRSGL